jgi:hypothetical protein
LYLVRSGCPWRCLPADLPPWQTVYWYFVRWEDAGVTEKLLAALPVTARVAQGREPEPSAGVLDSQSVKGADTVGKDSRGYDAGKGHCCTKRSKGSSAANPSEGPYRWAALLAVAMAPADHFARSVPVAGPA